jgi:hypothetical protein
MFLIPRPGPRLYMTLRSISKKLCATFFSLEELFNDLRIARFQQDIRDTIIWREKLIYRLSSSCFPLNADHRTQIISWDYKYHKKNEIDFFNYLMLTKKVNFFSGFFGPVV